MTQDIWKSVDDYLSATLALDDDVMLAVQAACDDGGLPAIQVSATQGKFLELLARMTGAKRILELGTLGGYSTIWMARGIGTDARIVTIEVDQKHADVAASNFRSAGVAEKIDQRVGAALDVLPVLAGEIDVPFDLSFIDADKANIPAYFDWAVRMSRTGSVIIVDNVIRDGAVIDATSEDPSVRGVRRLNEMMASDSRVSSTVLQTVGVKGYDGFAIALVVTSGAD
jgi:predicted O-methyltransferase YrrM